MKRFRGFGPLLALALGAALAGCATAPTTKDYSAFRAESPRSILVVPALNNTLNVPAPDFFLSTISRPFAERGYYVFPAHMVKRTMEDGGLGDPGLIHSTDASRLHRLFGCDSVLYVTIQEWESKYVVLATQTTVSFDYSLKSCKTGDVLWGTPREWSIVLRRTAAVILWEI
ncbi:MAG: GNA1162 family protein [Phenylobacterium sp.]|uniref:GNA1162 family protein n=1 Tax=Phenylobacterium sp. TaxID=1871053 RepID=UPI00391B60E9